MNNQHPISHSLGLQERKDTNQKDLERVFKDKMETGMVMDLSLRSSWTAVLSGLLSLAYSTSYSLADL